MAGVVTSVLTDKELDILIDVFECAPIGCELTDDYWALHSKLVAWRRSLDCDAGKCATTGYPAPDVGRKRDV